MRLLFINRYFYPDISATSQLLTELAEDLAGQGEEVTVVTGNVAYSGDGSRFTPQEIYKGIRIVRVGFTRFGRRSTLGRLVDYLSFWMSAFWKAIFMKDQDCLVVLSDPPMLSILAALVQILKPIKTVCWLQDVFPDIATKANVLPEGIVARGFKKLALWSLRQMDQVVVIGRCMERRLLSDGIPSQSISRISNWADGELIRSVPRTENEFIQEHGLQGKFVVMYSGNLGVVHEFDTVMALIRDLQAVPNLVFCFIGQGRRKDPLVATAARENWQHVLCLPYQPKASLPASLSAADIHLVSLRSDMEGLSVPSKLYGILAVGRPVLFIGPTNSEAAAVIRDARCGYVVQPGDVQGAAQAILAGYHNRALLEKQGQQARRYFAQHCDRSLATERFQQVFERVCETSPRTSMALKTISPSSRSH